MDAPRTIPPLNIGVSACLAGQPVRYDGGDKAHLRILHLDSPWLRLHTLCPEVGIGLPVPRPPIQRVAEGDGFRVQGVDDRSLDVTEALRDFADSQLARHELDGMVLQSRSPSCGLHGVKLFSRSGELLGEQGSGAFADQLGHAAPGLARVEDCELDDDEAWCRFLLRAAVYQRWRAVPARLSALADFHADHKYLLMARDGAAPARLGRLLNGDLSAESAREAYATALWVMLEQPLLPGREANAWAHLVGHLSDKAQAVALQQCVAAFANGERSREALRHEVAAAFQRCPDAYAQRQVLLHPHPAVAGFC